jgi:hypothetical protein
LFLKRLAPAALQWHKTETRISAIAHFVRRCKRKKKALLLSLFDSNNSRSRRDEARIFLAAKRYPSRPPIGPLRAG